MGIDVDEHTAVPFSLAPAVEGVVLSQSGDVARLAINHSQAVQMAAVLRRQRRDKRRPPARHEIVSGAAGAEAGEARIHEPEFVAGPGHFVYLDVAGEVDR